MSRSTSNEQVCLWDNLAANPDQLGIPARHAKLLAEDHARYQANPAEGSSWAEVKSRITGHVPYCRTSP
ncbi:MAG: addiction module protein [Verrucomicrobia bacterium]|nr:addiction module protein [Verrucomicrobiota bacterium]